jgi:hypothetical protein
MLSPNNIARIIQANVQSVKNAVAISGHPRRQWGLCGLSCCQTYKAKYMSSDLATLLGPGGDPLAGVRSRHPVDYLTVPRAER